MGVRWKRGLMLSGAMCTLLKVNHWGGKAKVGVRHKTNDDECCKQNISILMKLLTFIWVWKGILEGLEG
jgi:hypothetical protein